MLYLMTDVSSVISNINGLMSGTAELLTLLGTGLAFVIRSRRNSRREKIRTEAAATLAAQETKRTLEARLEEQHAAQIKQLQDQIDSQKEQYENQLSAEREQTSILRSQYSSLQREYQRLVERLLGQQRKEETYD